MNQPEYVRWEVASLARKQEASGLRSKHTQTGARREIFSTEGAFARALMAPAMITMGVLLLLPAVYAFWMSLHKIHFGTRTYTFVGLRNYIDIFRDPRILNSFVNTLVFSLSVTVITLVLSLLLALLLNQDFKGRELCRALLLVPWALAPLANGLMWKWMLNPRLGLLNNLLITLGLLKDYPNWLMNPRTAMLAVIIAMVYKTLPLITLLFLAALQSIPPQLYEAAVIDGAGVLGSFRRITLPLLKPSMVIILVILSVNTLKAFDLIHVLTEGGPADATAVVNYMSYIQSFKLLRFGYGAALAFIVSLIILLFSMFYYKTMYTSVPYE